MPPGRSAQVTGQRREPVMRMDEVVGTAPVAEREGLDTGGELLNKGSQRFLLEMLRRPGRG